MKRLAALIALAALTAPVAAQATTGAHLLQRRHVKLVGRHQLHRAPLHPALHAALRGAPAGRRALAPVLPPAPAEASTNESPALDAGERQLVDAMNHVRAEHGLRTLTASAALAKAANVHSVEMVQRGYFEHESANGEDFSVRVTRYYPRNGAHVWSIGENLAYGCPSLSVDEAMDMWMHSAGHRANILDRDWTEVGVSIVHVDSAPGEYDGDPTTVMTVDFAVRG